MLLNVDTASLVRFAGWSAAVAFIALIASGVALALFFGGAGAFWGPVNDVAFSITMIALIPAVVAIDRLAEPGSGAWLRVVTVAAIAGLLLGAAGQLLLVAGVIDLQTSFVTGGVGILPFFVWLGALAILAWSAAGGSIVPPTIGWLVVAVFGLTGITAAVGTLTTGPLLWVACVGLLIALLAWLGSLASLLLTRSTPT